MMLKTSKKNCLSYSPLDVCINNVIRVDVPGLRQLLASSAYLNSSSQTTCSKNI